MIDVDPDRWLPSRDYAAPRQPKVGMRVAWRYAVWLVVDIHPLNEQNWEPGESGRLNRMPERLREVNSPRTVVLQHECGPNLAGAPDGMVHLRLGPYKPTMDAVARRYQTCSCHGHPWPCMGYDRDRLVAGQTRKTERLLAGAQPGVCAYCLEPVTARQKTLTFPEPSLLVPGAPGPTYHAQRWECWWSGAQRYEVEHRLAADPGLTRIASCPGTAFIHMVGQRVECTAGPGCTGLHGPYRVRPGDGNCAERVRHADNLAAGYKRPLTDCGYPGCLAAETGPCEPLPQGIGDLFGGQL